ncbi:MULTISPECIES: Rieske 2Fe-2S domain-containing protein [unclassified Streptomyces]|uniref:Rieske 2Fe-2S domain-containing protein n=1 Tax=unclassified Streptomyces TaxID=2593676 RepID=UPI00081DC20F|nr:MULTISPECIES: Rieske 2Fe-2S domain-containing protein [unclassified Streptomyces]MYZ35207.1 Rieske 2Fe-2S domain-containing protein [Streptomyces sp. SID4917]SCF73605.1 5,5'-dehydrodivanillate O-demethylase [Streptomyces sp. MnatMP-M17]
MISEAENEFLTRVGPGTPAGDLLRRYWQPVAVTADLSPEKRTKRIRVLGEDLVLYLTDENTYALVAEACAHRRVSLYYGFVEGCEIRCPYHGWKYDRTGQCLEQPFEQENRRARERARIAAYPVQAYRGIVFAYLGPGEPPVLPRWDVLDRRDGHLTLFVEEDLQCNWLQPMENAVDTVHTFWLHGHTMRMKGIDRGSYYYRPIEKYSFEQFEWGIIKRRVYRDNTGELEEETGHPLVFPNILRLPEGPLQAMHWRVPVDDEHTMLIRAGLLPDKPGEERVHDEEPSVVRVPSEMTADGDHAMNTFTSQDRMAWETQGAVYDRTKEMLGAEDKGIAMYRRLLRQQIERVQAGEDPMALIRDPAQAVVTFDVSRGQARVAVAEGRV